MDSKKWLHTCTWFFSVTGFPGRNIICSKPPRTSIRSNLLRVKGGKLLHVCTHKKIGINSHEILSQAFGACFGYFVPYKIEMWDGCPNSWFGSGKKLLRDHDYTILGHMAQYGCVRYLRYLWVSTLEFSARRDRQGRSCHFCGFLKSTIWEAQSKNTTPNRTGRQAQKPGWRLEASHF